MFSLACSTTYQRHHCFVQCESGLFCFQRSRYGAVPGCSGGEFEGSNTDYCARLPQSQLPEPGGTFRLKLYWEEGYFWQEVRTARKKTDFDLIKANAVALLVLTSIRKHARVSMLLLCFDSVYGVTELKLRRAVGSSE
jgi:hypothetical protein